MCYQTTTLVESEVELHFPPTGQPSLLHDYDDLSNPV